MPRQFLPVFAVVVGLTGCAGMGDTLTSRRFRDKPFDTLFRPGDPLKVMMESGEGDQRAAAMRRLKEPIRDGRTQEEQDAAVKLLTAAATTDPSPVVRVAAVDALGRFEDPRAVEVLTAAYYQAAGGRAADKASLAGPSGFPPEMVAVIRTRSVECLAATGRPEAVPVLARVATTKADDADPEADRDVRLAAVRGLAKLRVPQSAEALAKVLSSEKGKDPALSGRAHEGLVTLTGLQHPADPQVWDGVVRAGVTIAPEPGGIERAVGWVVP